VVIVESEDESSMMGGPDLRAGRSIKADSQGNGAILGGQLGDLPLPRSCTPISGLRTSTTNSSFPRSRYRL